VVRRKWIEKEFEVDFFRRALFFSAMLHDIGKLTVKERKKGHNRCEVAEFVSQKLHYLFEDVLELDEKWREALVNSVSATILLHHSLRKDEPLEKIAVKVESLKKYWNSISKVEFSEERLKILTMLIPFIVYEADNLSAGERGESIGSFPRELLQGDFLVDPMVPPGVEFSTSNNDLLVYLKKYHSSKVFPIENGSVIAFPQIVNKSMNEIENEISYSTFFENLLKHRTKNLYKNWWLFEAILEVFTGNIVSTLIKKEASACSEDNSDSTLSSSGKFTNDQDREESRVNISLFDHLKSTAALSVLISYYLLAHEDLLFDLKELIDKICLDLEAISSANLSTDLLKKLSSIYSKFSHFKGSSNPENPVLRAGQLVVDITGIQNFIVPLVDQKFLKNIKSRSFLIELVIKLVGVLLVEMSTFPSQSIPNLHNPCSLLSAGAGKMTLLVYRGAESEDEVSEGLKRIFSNKLYSILLSFKRKGFELKYSWAFSKGIEAARAFKMVGEFCEANGEFERFYPHSEMLFSKSLIDLSLQSESQPLFEENYASYVAENVIKFDCIVNSCELCGKEFCSTSDVEDEVCFSCKSVFNTAKRLKEFANEGKSFTVKLRSKNFQQDVIEMLVGELGVGVEIVNYTSLEVEKESLGEFIIMNQEAIEEDESEEKLIVPLKYNDFVSFQKIADESNSPDNAGNGSIKKIEDDDKTSAYLVIEKPIADLCVLVSGASESVVSSTNVFSRYAIMLLDVNSLGSIVRYFGEFCEGILSSGLSNEKVFLGRLSGFLSFSRYLENFFKLVVKQVLDELKNLISKGSEISRLAGLDAKEFPILSFLLRQTFDDSQFSVFLQNLRKFLVVPDLRLHVVFAGGDDVFLLGKWQDVLTAGWLISKMFAGYSLGKLSLSAGFSWAKPTYPVRKLYERAQEGEKTAKDYFYKECNTAYAVTDKSGYVNANGLYAPLGINLGANSVGVIDLFTFEKFVGTEEVESIVDKFLADTDYFTSSELYERHIQNFAHVVWKTALTEEEISGRYYRFLQMCHKILDYIHTFRKTIMFSSLSSEEIAILRNKVIKEIALLLYRMKYSLGRALKRRGERAQKLMKYMHAFIEKLLENLLLNEENYIVSETVADEKEKSSKDMPIHYYMSILVSLLNFSLQIKREHAEFKNWG